MTQLARSLVVWAALTSSTTALTSSTPALTRRHALRSLGVGVATSAATASSASAAAAPPLAGVDALKSELRDLLAAPTPPPIAASDARAGAIDAALDRLCALNPTPRPGSAAAIAPVAPGRWRVAFAPHIAKLSSLAGTRFDPILYNLARDGSIVSNVRYSTLGGFKGWLSTSGSFGSRDDATSFVEWDDAWWQPGDAEAPGGPDEGFAAPVVSALGRLGFVNAFANFPVRYLDADLCVFVFPLSNTRIVAVREGGALGSIWG